ncbi:hypothetical protein [Fibrobacter sp.]|uniref:hypothetical protein n=2 Tax=Fibrobacter TaxID=832 RepID=UPI0025BB46AE|nr:hypothetical protein [Fibrobacter sp.]MBS7271962.1 hypothetical protein [Fibrobacter sp.]MCI6437629.1 hypothetical protein [Fibrobacter sp.]
MKKLLLFLMALVAFANAELQSVKFTPEEKSNDGLKAFIGVSGGNVLVADDGAIFANIRIGLDILPQISTGVWVSRLLSDVRNYNVAEKQMIKYMSFGGFVELFPLRLGDFAISVPIEVGGGALYVMEPDDEAFESEDYFFTADMAVHFNYRVTRMLEVSIGGGYRMFNGIETNGLENLDFCTPFGELRFTIRE